jgi:hypothetical protein
VALTPRDAGISRDSRFRGPLFDIGLLRETSLAQRAVAGETKMLTRATNSDFAHRRLLRRIIHRKRERSFGTSEMTINEFLALSGVSELLPLQRFLTGRRSQAHSRCSSVAA